jgi:hypothetical protein
MELTREPVKVSVIVLKLAGMEDIEKEISATRAVGSRRRETRRLKTNE